MSTRLKPCGVLTTPRMMSRTRRRGPRSGLKQRRRPSKLLLQVSSDVIPDFQESLPRHSFSASITLTASFSIPDVGGTSLSVSISSSETQTQTVTDSHQLTNGWSITWRFPFTICHYFIFILRYHSGLDHTKLWASKGFLRLSPRKLHTVR